MITVTIFDFILTGLLLLIIIAVIKFYIMIKPAAKTIVSDANKHVIDLSDSVYNVIVQKIICKLKVELHASKIVIGRFHNGGNYVNGLPMKKFTLAFETEGGTDMPMMDKCVGVLNSRYSQAFAQLATLDEFYISDIEDCMDLNFKRDMKMWGFHATYLFLIRQFDGREDGFVGINFKETKVMTKEERHKVEEQIPRIIGLLNMNKEQLKGNE